jgi:hypothetical protein
MALLSKQWVTALLLVLPYGRIGDEPIATVRSNEKDAGIPDTQAATPDASKTCEGKKTACADACVDTQTDPKNCGICGSDCGDTPCSAGMCQPVAIARNLRKGASGLAVKGGTAYIQGAFYIYRCGTSGPGCQSVTQLWQGTPDSYKLSPRAFEVGKWNGNLSVLFRGSRPGQATNTIEEGLFVQSLAGASDPLKVVDTFRSPIDFRYLETEQEAVEIDPYGVYSYPVTNSFRQVIGEDGNLALAVTKSAYLYTTAYAPAALKTCPRPIQEASIAKSPNNYCTVLATTGSPLMPVKARLEVAAGRAFWVDENTTTKEQRIQACDVGGCRQNPDTIALGLEPISGFAVTPKGVFWSNALTGNIYQCKEPKGCSAGKSVAILKGLQSPTELAFDEGLLYVLLQGGGGDDGQVLKFSPP